MTTFDQLTAPQQAAMHDAAGEPIARRGRLVVSTTGKRWDCGWVHPKTADALVRLGVFEWMTGYGAAEIRWTAAGAELGAAIIAANERHAAAHAERARARERRRNLGIPVNRRGLTVVPDQE